MLDSVDKLTDIVRWVCLSQFSLTMRLIILPFAFVLIIALLVYLKPSAFFFAIDPLPSIKISICIQHRSISMRDVVKLLSFVFVLPNFVSWLRLLHLFRWTFDYLFFLLFLRFSTIFLCNHWRPLRLFFITIESTAHSKKSFHSWFKNNIQII